VATVLAGVTGAIAGLVIGLFAYVPTAPIAAAEIGFPAAVAGAIIGLAGGLIATTAVRIRRYAAGSRTNHFQGHQRR
jgi:hypothetical protein